MKYMLLIHQADAPTPRSPEAWAKLSDAEQQAVYADYRAINETPGMQLDDPATATTVRMQARSVSISAFDQGGACAVSVERPRLVDAL
jgi:hypothetical protein